jgi:peroxiredoxin Q/BCP
MLQEGIKAPEFTLPDHENKPRTLSEFRGKKVVLYFYPKDETPGCTKEACSLRDGYAELREKGAAVIGISPDKPESHAKFKAHHGLPFILLSDPGHGVMEAYGAWGEKTMYGKKTIGVKRISYVIDEEGIIRKAFGKVDTAAHAAQVLPFV